MILTNTASQCHATAGARGQAAAAVRLTKTNTIASRRCSFVQAAEVAENTSNLSEMFQKLKVAADCLHTHPPPASPLSLSWYV